MTPKRPLSRGRNGEINDYRQYTGIPIFPVVPRGKAPLTTHGFEDATTDEATIRQWWSRWPDANIAMPTGMASGYDVLDVDVRPDGNGWGAFARLKQAGLLSGAVGVIRTPSTGIHLYFLASGQGCGRLKSHWLDLKADGGYVLLPPSHVKTDAYEGDYVLEDARPGPGQPLNWEACKRLLEPPSIVAPAQQFTGPANVASLADWLRKQPIGNRNAALYWAANRAIEGGADNLAELVAAAVDTGLSEFDAAKTCLSAQKGARR